MQHAASMQPARSCLLRLLPSPMSSWGREWEVREEDERRQREAAHRAAKAGAACQWADQVRGCCCRCSARRTAAPAGRLPGCFRVPPTTSQRAATHQSSYPSATCRAVLLMLRRGTQFLEPLSDGAEVALVTMMGSLNPVTRGHVQCFEAARELLLGVGGGDSGSSAGHFDCVVGLFMLNPDTHVQHKLGKTVALLFDERRALVELATVDLPWLGCSAELEAPRHRQCCAGKRSALLLRVRATCSYPFRSTWRQRGAGLMQGGARRGPDWLAV